LAGAGREDYDGFVGHVSDVITYGVVMKESWNEKRLGHAISEPLSYFGTYMM
jgi:hypothetical protein